MGQRSSVQFESGPKETRLSSSGGGVAILYVGMARGRCKRCKSFGRAQQQDCGGKRRRGKEKRYAFGRQVKDCEVWRNGR